VVRIFAKDTVESKVVALQKEKRSGVRAQLRAQQQRDLQQGGARAQNAKDALKERHNEVCVCVFLWLWLDLLPHVHTDRKCHVCQPLLSLRAANDCSYSLDSAGRLSLRFLTHNLLQVLAFFNLDLEGRSSFDELQSRAGIQ
jgi:hypothetical protein